MVVAVRELRIGSTLENLVQQVRMLVAKGETDVSAVCERVLADNRFDGATQRLLSRAGLESYVGKEGFDGRTTAGRFIVQKDGPLPEDLPVPQILVRKLRRLPKPARFVLIQPRRGAGGEVKSFGLFTRLDIHAYNQEMQKRITNARGALAAGEAIEAALPDDGTVLADLPVAVLQPLTEQLGRALARL